MRTLTLPAVLLTVCMLISSGCTVLGIASTGVAIGTPKHGFFHKRTTLVKADDLPAPKAPLNLTLKVRYIIQGIDTGNEDVVSNSAELLFLDNFTKNIKLLLEKRKIKTVESDGADGEIYVEASNIVEDLGWRYVPFMSAFKVNEKKIGKMRITLTNRDGQSVSSGLTEENIYVQSGVFADKETAEYKQGVFEVPRVDFVLKGEFVTLDHLNEQLFYQTMQKIYQQLDLNVFFRKEETIF